MFFSGLVVIVYKFSEYLDMKLWEKHYECLQGTLILGIEVNTV